ncbi:MAG: phosphoglycerate kinase [bacterium]|nr:phosphoglycerate kinase [bacterium]
MKSIREADVKGKRVLLRVDFNVPLSEGTVTDDARIRGSLPTIKYLADEGAKVIILTHLGRPSGIGFEADFSVAPAARVLGRLLGAEVLVSPEVTGEASQQMVDALENGQVLMLENLRFDPREKKNDVEFAAELAKFGDIYCNDAFGAAHRAHASIDVLAGMLPHYSGLLLDKEVEVLGAMLESPERPFIAILGGSKVSDKIKIINNLINIVDKMLVGGGMCFTFLAAQGYDVGKSIVEEDCLEDARNMLAKAAEKGVDIVLPIDFVVADQFSESATVAIRGYDEIPSDMMGLDIGPASCELFKSVIMEGKTVFWNGPQGVFEMKPFENGTRKVAEALAANKAATTVVGGGDSGAAIAKFGLADEVTFVSTGGGASMRMVEGCELPAIVALNA